jgi:septum formation topological specificity factor MinE
MAKVIPFPNTHKQTSDMVEEIISIRMAHKHPEILSCLKSEMTELVKKYFNGEELSLSLELPRDLSDEQFTTIEQGIQKTISDHNRQMNNRANQLFLDLCISRMAICELRHRLEKDA